MLSFYVDSMGKKLYLKGEKAYFACYYRGGEAVTRPNTQSMISTKGNTPQINATINTFFIINLLHDNDKHIYSYMLNSATKKRAASCFMFYIWRCWDLLVK